MKNRKETSAGIWGWILIALIVAALAVGILFYIGWFDNNSHVDTPAGDNVEEQYEISTADPDAPGQADWQNADHESLQEVVTE